MIVLAREEARTLKHNYIGTEHILLGLLGEKEGLAGWVLGSLNITAERVREQVVQAAGTGHEAASTQIPFTPHAKKGLELALREALSLGHNYIGTEHILLGLVSENQGLGARILLDLGADAQKIRAEVIRGLSGRRRPPQPGASRVEPSEDPAEAASTGTVGFPDLGGMSDSELDNLIDVLHSEREKRRRQRPESDP